MFVAGLLGCGFALCMVGPALAVSAVARSRSQVTPGDALADGTVPWASLGLLTAMGLAGIGAAFALFARRDLAR
ncbi:MULTISPECIES: hypothetical protein [unclassified Kitasatospora]|uniref:hypothetical protein n=1 Tax=unclassified Kitasatospora TaxID=2633591 RepID=UPI00070F7305|nr:MULTISPECIES: hypothetical protein [unclassified Kitasatospora]KQV19300.1 hypothetical protein ASC99_24495 [Kitasatospora sp. Root107]KRB77575.1 hypothetical protein ASE03_00690 [Kitasatospora sp. Root187]